MEEIWRDIEGYEGLYQVSNLGNVKSLNYLHTGRVQVLKPAKNNSGYLQVNLCKDGKVERYLVHRLVAEAFLPNPEKLPCVNHKNCNKIDNRSFNLEFCTYSYNNSYGEHSIKQRDSHIKNLSNNKRCRTVIKYSLLNEYIEEYLSARRASEDNMIQHSSIIRCCQGKYKSAGGYIWKWADR